jgi:hypothetical protein
MYIEVPEDDGETRAINPHFLVYAWLLMMMMSTCYFQIKIPLSAQPLLLRQREDVKERAKPKHQKTSPRPFLHSTFIHSFHQKNTHKHSIHYHSQALKESQKKTHNDK